MPLKGQLHERSRDIPGHRPHDRVCVLPPAATVDSRREAGERVSPPSRRPSALIRSSDRAQAPLMTHPAQHGPAPPLSAGGRREPSAGRRGSSGPSFHWLARGDLPRSGMTPNHRRPASYFVKQLSFLLQEIVRIGERRRSAPHMYDVRQRAAPQSPRPTLVALSSV
jgi:hypothetical protein